MSSRIKSFFKAKEGFTIIEVMIVLAIAGLIMIIVFLAIPQLQRSQRNTRRKDALNRIKTELDNYAANNSGVYPVAAVASAATNFGTPATTLGFMVRYLGCSTTGGVTTCTGNIDDPRTAQPLGTGTFGGTALTTTVAAAGTPVGNEPGSIAYGTTLLCAGEDVAATGAGARNYVVTLRLEGGAVYCLDNR